MGGYPTETFDFFNLFPAGRDSVRVSEHFQTDQIDRTATQYANFHYIQTA